MTNAAAPFTRRKIVVLLACVSIFALGQFHRASGSVFTPLLMDRFAASAATIGVLVSVMFFATIAAQVPFGAILDRKGPRFVLLWCIALIAAGTATFAVQGSYSLTLGSRVLIGVGMASMGAATHVIVARNFARRDFGYASGLVVTIGGVGGMLGTYPLAFALERFDWEVVFGVVAVLSLGLMVLVLKAIRPGAATPEQDRDDAVQAGGYLSLLRQRELLKVMVMGFVTFAPIAAITGLWGGPFFQDVAGMDAEQAGLALLLLFVATIVGGYVFSVLDRRARSRKRVVLCAAALSAACFAGLALWPQPGVSAAVGLLVTMVFFQQFYIPLGAHMRKVVPDHLLGRASTLLNLVAVTAIPLLQIGFGVVLDQMAALGFAPSDQYRAAFAGMGVVVGFCTIIYAGTRDGDDAA